MYCLKLRLCIIIVQPLINTVSLADLAKGFLSCKVHRHCLGFQPFFYRPLICVVKSPVCISYDREIIVNGITVILQYIDQLKGLVIDLVVIKVSFREEHGETGAISGKQTSVPIQYLPSRSGGINALYAYGFRFFFPFASFHYRKCKEPDKQECHQSNGNQQYLIVSKLDPLHMRFRPSIQI